VATARKLLKSGMADVPEDEQGDVEPAAESNLSALGPDEQALLRQVITDLEAVARAPDPKVEVVLAYLRDRDWLESHGAILFSQYLTTAEWVAEALTAAFPNEPVALYAGGAASFVLKGGERRSAKREEIKAAVQRGDVRLLCATDAACEGLNLQRLGAQFNLDLPWNPSRLEQRKGRVQRIGQARESIHVVNLRYAGTVEDTVYAALSARMGDIFQVVGQLPDGFEDAWVEAVLRDREAVRHFPQRFETLRPPMELRYARDVADDRGLDWEATTRIIADRDLDDFLRAPW
jgi:superfamily II DNA or RNA helicase